MSQITSNQTTSSSQRVAVYQQGRGCYVVELDGREYTRFGTLADAYRFARELDSQLRDKS